MISYAVIFLYIAVALGEYSSWKRILVRLHNVNIIMQYFILLIFKIHQRIQYIDRPPKINPAGLSQQLLYESTFMYILRLILYSLFKNLKSSTIIRLNSSFIHYFVTKCPLNSFQMSIKLCHVELSLSSFLGC